MRRLVLLAVAGVLAGSTGCAKQSAESAITKTETALAAIKDQAEKLAPSDLKSLTDSLAGMKAKVAAGDYDAALMGARGLGNMVRDLSSQLEQRKGQLNTTFTAMTAELPKQIEELTAKVTQLAGMKKLPGGIDPAKFAALKTDAAGWGAAWTAAADAFKAGNLAEAVSKGTELKNKVAAATALLGG